MDLQHQHKVAKGQLRRQQELQKQSFEERQVSDELILTEQSLHELKTDYAVPLQNRYNKGLFTNIMQVIFPLSKRKSSQIKNTVKDESGSIMLTVTKEEKDSSILILEDAKRENPVLNHAHFPYGLRNHRLLAVGEQLEGLEAERQKKLRERQKILKQREKEDKQSKRNS